MRTLTALLLLAPMAAQAQAPAPRYLTKTDIETALGYSLKTKADVTDIRAAKFAGGAKCDGVTDDTAAIQSALTYAASAAYGALVYSPAGRCVVSATLHMTIPTAGVRLTGDGKDASEWIFTGLGDGLDATLASGGWWLRNNESSFSGASIDVSRLGFVSNSSTPGGISLGTALQVLGDNVTGRPGPNTAFSDLALHGYGGSQSWTRGIYASRVSNAVFDNITWTGKNQTVSGVGIEIAGTPGTNEATGIVIRNPTATFADTAIKIGPGIQGVTVDSPNFTNVSYGVDWELPAGQLEDGLFVNNGFIGYSISGVKTANIYDVNVHHAYFLPSVGGTPAVHAANAGLLQVNGNTFRGSYRTGEAAVFASRDSTVPVQYGSLIDGNVISNLGGTTIQFGPNYVGPLAIGDNIFSSNAMDYDEANLPVGVTILPNSRLGAAVIGAPTKGTIIQGVGSIPLGTMIDSSIVHNSVVNGFSIVEPAGVSGDLLTCAGTLANGAVTYPKAPANHQIYTLATQCAVTVFTASGGAGMGLAVNSYPASLAAGSSYSVMFEQTGNAWYRWH